MPQLVVGSADFDFEIASWRVSHRRLKQRLARCEEWDLFSGLSTTRRVMGGAGNIEDNLIDAPGGEYRAIAVRSFDATRGLWAIWWLSGLAPHTFEPPVVGRFERGEGVFLGEDVLHGEAVKVRFLWLRTSTGSPRWEQAFSGDGGASWETNWTMDFTAAEAAPV